MAASRHYTNAKMGDARDYATKWVDKVPQVDIDTFLKHFMPKRELDAQHTTADIAEALSKRWLFPLRSEDGLRLPDADVPLDVKNSRWFSFEQDPEFYKGPENREGAVFKRFEDIFDQVIECCKVLQPGLTQTTRYYNEGDRMARSEKRNTSRRDADFRLLDGCEDRYYELAVIVQLKKVDSMASQFDDWKKINWELLHVARTEPGRRFCLGMTVENRKVRLWHLNREIMVVSEAFDFMTDYKILIEVFLRFGFAQRSELGYDPTFEKPPAPQPSDSENSDVTSGEEEQFVTVSDCKYRIVETLANYRADAGIGRCTWVWLAEAVDNPAKRVVVKDCWMANDRDTEFEILQEIRKRIKEHDWKKYASPSNPTSTERVDPLNGSDIDRSLFFVNITDGVRVKVDDKVDDTRAVIAHGFDFPGRWSFLPLVEVARPTTPASSLTLTAVHGKRSTPSQSRPGAHVSDSVGNQSEREMQRPLVGLFDRGTEARAHHRMVMEYGTPLTAISEPSLVFSILTDAACALFILHCVGYLDRDISVNNILHLYWNVKGFQGKIGVLSDLEYARKIDEEGAHLGRTGTRHFMAVEVAEGDYMLKAAESAIPKSLIADRIKKPRAVESSPFPIPAAPPLIPWRFCEVHDMESIFWVALYTLFRHTNLHTIALKGTEYDVEAQYHVYSEMFPDDADATHDRSKYIRLEHKLKDAVTKLPPTWQELGESFRVVRQCLAEFYEQVGERQIDREMWNWLKLACEAGQEGIDGPFISLAAALDKKTVSMQSGKRQGDTVEEEGAAKKAKVE
ncbi:hypothetical protein BD626DRAFT_511402 [Schizophyllum amplum]|uniref:Fungal-type protein kinase domain-containing protein n=1 Tax=Schizophyllum amplum TaxID=97359 RepID=A0A550C197_9AGAR|nr:hypothetical protein BD626DRAFT_511402 [Auriculariopsis ampla]